MNAVQHAHTTTATMRVMWLAVALALFAALSYLLIQLSMLGVGDLRTAGGPAIALVAAGCYLVGGLITKIAQVLLEGCLLYLIITDWRSAHHQVR
jgi:hypothetical protein